MTMRKFYARSAALIFGLLVSTGAIADCHPGYYTICWQDRADCLANPPPGMYPQAHCDLMYRLCLADAECSGQ